MSMTGRAVGRVKAMMNDAELLAEFEGNPEFEAEEFDSAITCALTDQLYHDLGLRPLDPWNSKAAVATWRRAARAIATADTTLGHGLAPVDFKRGTVAMVVARSIKKENG